jgi:predicted Zn-dependent protease
MRDASAYSAMTTMILAAGVLAACETVPYTGRSQLQLMSAQQEGQMGVQTFQGIVEKAKLSSDAALSEMVARVGRRIAAVSGHPEYQWEYRLIQDDKQVNAFALPGGKVAVYTGILPVTRDENGLAAVLGHEIGHVVARHGGERANPPRCKRWARSLVPEPR